MLKLVVATLATVYAIFLVVGEPGRRVETTRSVTSPDASGLSLASFARVEPIDFSVDLLVPQVTETEAIRLALASGAAARCDRVSIAFRGLASAKTATAPADDKAVASKKMVYWYVTGSNVNLRQGPGTANAVVARVTFGTEAEVLFEKNGWFQIQTADGSASGWIYGKFLNRKRPG